MMCLGAGVGYSELSGIGQTLRKSEGELTGHFLLLVSRCCGCSTGHQKIDVKLMEGGGPFYRNHVCDIHCAAGCLPPFHWWSL
jgi:hypothetical protein